MELSSTTPLHVHGLEVQFIPHQIMDRYAGAMRIKQIHQSHNSNQDTGGNGTHPPPPPPTPSPRNLRLGAQDQ
jgi:hypothetical protein